jgi:hypothetical protein
MARQKKAANAYELLGRVCEAIEARPLSYYQGWWSQSRGATGVCALEDELNTPENECGTAYCRAGWIVALHDGHHVAKDWRRVQDRACALLDMDEFDTDELFNGGAVPLSLTPGSTRYVRAGIAGVRAFMRKHKAHLQARSLRGV